MSETLVTEQQQPHPSSSSSSPPVQRAAGQPVPGQALVKPPIAGPGDDPSKVLSDLLAHRQEVMLRKLDRMAFYRGQVLFDGRWMSSDEARRVYRGMWLRSIVMIGETLFLIAVLVGAAGFVGLLLALVAGLQIPGQ